MAGNDGARFLDILESWGQAIAIRQDGKLVFANQAFATLYGYDSPQEIAPPHSDGEGECEASLDSFEVEAVRKDGAAWWAEFRGQEIDWNGAPAVMFAVNDISERKRAEASTSESEDLARREARLRAILDNAIDGIATIDEHGTVESFNPAAERIFGYTTEEVVGRNINLLMPEPDRDRHDGYVNNYLTTGEAKIIGRGREVAGRHKDGHEVPIELAVADSSIDGERRFTGIMRDVSERKRAEEDLAQAERNFRTILDSSPIGISVVDPESKQRRYVNPRFLELMGAASAEELASRPAVDSYVDIEEFARLDARLDAGELFVDVDVARRRLDGSEWWCLLNSTTSTYAGQDSHIVWIYDNTERKLAAEEISRQSELVRQVLGTVHQGVVKLDGNRNIETWNRQYEDIFGIPDGFLEAGQPIEVLTRYLAEKGEFGEGDIETLVEQRLKILGSDTAARREAPLSGGRILDVAAEPTSDGGLVITYTDITGHKRAAEKIDQQAQLLSQVLDTVAQGVVKFDSDRKLAVWNRQYQDMLGLPDGLMRIGRSNLDLALYLAKHGSYGGGDVESLVEERLQSLWSGTASRTEVSFGDNRTFDIAAEPTNDGGLVITYTDITDIKEAQAELEENRQVLRDVLDNIGQAVVRYDNRRNLLIWNRNFQDMQQFPDELMKVGQSVLALAVRWSHIVGQVGGLVKVYSAA